VRHSKNGGMDSRCVYLILITLGSLFSFENAETLGLYPKGEGPNLGKHLLTKRISSQHVDQLEIGWLGFWYDKHPTLLPFKFTSIINTRMGIWRMQITSIYHIHSSIQRQIKVQVSLGICEVIEIYHLGILYWVDSTF